VGHPSRDNRDLDKRPGDEDYLCGELNSFF
jgi:hypothetical protein